MQNNNLNRQKAYPSRGTRGSSVGRQGYPQNRYGTPKATVAGRYKSHDAGRANPVMDHYSEPAVRRNRQGTQAGYTAVNGRANGYAANGASYNRSSARRENIQKNATYQRGGAYNRSRTYGERVMSEEERLFRMREKAEAIEAARRRAAAREMRRKIEFQIKQERKMRRKRQRKIFRGRALVCLIMFIILLSITGMAFAFLFFRSPDSPPSSNIVYTYGGAEVRTVSSDQAFKNDKMYVCFNDVAKYLDYSVTGDTESMKFVLPHQAENGDASYTAAETGSEGDGTEEYVKFLVDSRTVIINGQQITLPSKTVMYGENIWVSSDFLSEFMEGLSVNYTKKEHKIEISRILDAENSTKSEKVYLPVSLKLKSASPIPTVGGTDNNAQPTAPEVTFSTDLSSYEQYMNPENSEDYLTLVNSENTLDAEYIPEDLTNIENTRDDGRAVIQLRLCAAKALDALFFELKAAGYTDVSVTSGYRGYDYQSTLFESYVNREMNNDPNLTREAAEAIVVTYSSRPGTSEHQSGLCVDMHNLPEASTEFGNDPAYTWLCENAWKFGFILRYPEAKTDITSISYEPWHWRFVGRDAAYKISSSSMCLEEYAASIN